MFIKQCIVCLFSCFTIAQAFAAGTQNLPQVLQKPLASAKVNADSVSIWIARAGENRPVFEHNSQKLMQPASIIKTVTTAAALDLLKPNYYWTTDFISKSAPNQKGVISQLGVIGQGDPHLVVERIWLAAERLHDRGVRQIQGNITVDRSLFNIVTQSQSSFDGAGNRPYNVLPDAALLNLKTVSMSFSPEENGEYARVTVMPRLAGIQFPKRVRLLKTGRCGDWKSRLKIDLSKSNRVRFLGRYPEACGHQMWHLSHWSSDEYMTRLFKHVFAQVGIQWKGYVVPGAVDPKGYLLLREYSEPLTQMVDWINKFSSNPMARQVFLTLSFTDNEGKEVPATLDRSRAVLQNWLQTQVGIPEGQIIVDNGSGLSRKTRATAEGIGRVLTHAYRSPTMPEFMGSLPLAGVDGTMRKRPLKQGSAHVKTGLLRNVRSIAGYVTDSDGQRWVVVVMVNHPQPQNAQALTDAVLNWVGSGNLARYALENKR